MQQQELIKQALPVISNEALVNRLGLWSASIATFLSVAATAALAVTIMGYAGGLAIQLVCWIALAMALTVMTICVRNVAQPQYKVLGECAVAFTIVYAVLQPFNYFVQLTVVNFANTYGTISGLGLFSMANLHSVFWALEALGYGFQGVAMLFLFPIFSGGRLRSAIRWLLVIIGVSGLLGTTVYALDLNWTVAVATFVAWSLFIPILTAMLAVSFKREALHLRHIG